MVIDGRLKAVLRALTAVVLVVVYVPLLLVLLNSFNVDRTFTWPPPGLTLHWWSVAAHSTGARRALQVSIEVGLLATLIALVLGTMAALALRRTRFFGRNVGEGANGRDWLAAHDPDMYAFCVEMFEHDHDAHGDEVAAPAVAARS